MCYNSYTRGNAVDDERNSLMMIIICVLLINLHTARVTAQSLLTTRVVAYTIMTKLIWISVKAENQVPNAMNSSNHQNLNFLPNEKYPQCNSTEASLETRNAILLNNLCIIANRWNKEILGMNFSSDNVPQTRRGIFDPPVLETFEDRLYKSGEAYKWNDCLLKQRNVFRPYPGNCYTKKKKLNENQFKGWWSEVSGDIMYTFDFVLYNEVHRERRQNQFWYLILYLKTLATVLKNPIKIANLGIRQISVNGKMSNIRIYYALYLTKSLIAYAAKIAVKVLKKIACKVPKG